MENASTKNSGRHRLYFVDAIFTYLGQYFCWKNIYSIKINFKSRCLQSFNNLAQQMNVLYPAEQKGQQLGYQVLMTCDTWHLTGGGRWTFPPNLSSLTLTVWEWRFVEDIFTNDLCTAVTQLINELITKMFVDSDAGKWHMTSGNPKGHLFHEYQA